MIRKKKLIFLILFQCIICSVYVFHKSREKDDIFSANSAKSNKPTKPGTITPTPPSTHLKIPRIESGFPHKDYINTKTAKKKRVPRTVTENSPSLGQRKNQLGLPDDFKTRKKLIFFLHYQCTTCSLYVRIYAL